MSWALQEAANDLDEDEDEDDEGLF
jgi:hypothetical protein